VASRPAGRAVQKNVPAPSGAMIPKAKGGERPLGIPTIRERVAQTAAKLVLEPILEADLEPNAYGYRPKRSAQDAVREVHRLIGEGYRDVVDADLSKYFDHIPHSELLPSVARRIADGRMLPLLKMWLKAPVEEREEKGNRKLTGGQGKGTPQGGVASPLLANLYRNRFLKHRRRQGKGEPYGAHIVHYADDLVILSRGKAEEARAWTAGGDDSLGPDSERAEDLYPEYQARKLRFSGLHVWAALRVENRQAILGSQSVPEGDPATQGGGLGKAATV
jgi:RNA-directed DNA polymerase